MKSEPTIQIFLTIRNSERELDFDRITQVLALPPSTTRSISHVTAAGKPAPVSSSQWTASTERHIDRSVDEAFGRFWSALESKVDAIRKYCEETASDIVFTSKVRIEDWDDRPFVELSALSISRLAHLKASWQLDLVDLSR
jgi:hypothetical protein